MMRAVVACMLCVVSLPASAASSDAWAAHAAEVVMACTAASGLDKVRTLPAAEFEAHSATKVTGYVASGRMKGTRETMLCLFDKKTRKASAVAVPPDAGW